MNRVLRVACAALISLTLVQCGPRVVSSIPSAQYSAGTTRVVSAALAGQLNALRAQHGLPALSPDATLARVATAHAHDMIRNGYFGHVSSNGDTIVERGHAQGYNFCNIAENLAMGQPRFDTVLAHWMTSPTHRKNLLSPDVVEFALVHGPGNLWVLNTGRPGC